MIEKYDVFLRGINISGNAMRARTGVIYLRQTAALLKVSINYTDMNLRS